MASIFREPNGSKVIQWTVIDGDRKRRPKLRLGKVSSRAAEAVKVKVEDLVASQITGHAPSDETSRWVRDLPDRLHAKLAAHGLVLPRESATLAAFIDGYIEQRVDAKDTTKTVFKRVRRYLVEHFGADKPLRGITPGDADTWRLHLIAAGKADNTVRRSCGVAKQFFRVAVRRGLIESNPFADLVAAVKANAARTTSSRGPTLRECSTPALTRSGGCCSRWRGSAACAFRLRHSYFVGPTLIGRTAGSPCTRPRRSTMRARLSASCRSSLSCTDT